jgi:serine/threonine protein kinase
MSGISSVHPAFWELAPFVANLPDRFNEEGTCLHTGRNELRLFHREGYHLVVKSYKIPNIFNRFIYRYCRLSKAERAYRYALLFRQAQVGTPVPVAFITRGHFLLKRSFFVSLCSDLPHTFHELQTKNFTRIEDILRAVARATAAMHEAGFRHLDLTGHNILFDESPSVIPVEFVDLNRMALGTVSLKKGCGDLKYMDPNASHHPILIEEYLRCRNQKNR